jgi:hypothetical protein
MKRRFNLFGLAAAAGLAAGGLHGQETEYSAKLGFFGGIGDLRTGTTQIDRGSTYPTRYESVPILGTKGLGPKNIGIELGWDLKPGKDLGIGMGVQAGYVVIRADKDVPWGATAKTTFIGVDLIYQVMKGPLTLRTGPVLSSWDITQARPWNPVTKSAAPASTGALGETAFKLGWRAALEYRINGQWSASAVWVTSSWKTAVNPSYIGVQAGYKFNL